MTTFEPDAQRREPAHELALTGARQLTPSTREFEFRRSDGGNFRYVPGQFYRFTFADAEGAFERSYSGANLTEDAQDAERLVLVISGVPGGRATRLLLQPPLPSLAGLRCSIRGPYGRLVLPDPLPGRLILVATSVGLAPYLPILNQLANRASAGEALGRVELVLGVRSAAEWFYCQEHCDYAERHAFFGLWVCFSRETVQVPAMVRSFQGRVQACLPSLALDARRDLVFLCGNPNMIDEVFALLRQQGFSGRQVKREKYVYAREAEAAPAAGPTEEDKRLIAETMARLRKPRPAPGEPQA